jgi:hypothetical protein
MEEGDTLSFLGSNRELVLIHSSLDVIKVRGKVDVMVTPQFYTLKKEELPFKYAFQAKRIAPSLFDGFVENMFTLKYHVWQEGNMWVYVAYDPKEILDFLESRGLPKKKIGSLYFADQSVDLFVNPLPLSEEEALVKLDNTMVVVPRGVLDESMPQLKFSKRFTPAKGGVSLSVSSDNSFINQKQAAMIAGMLAIFGAEYFVEGTRKVAEGSSNDELMALYTKYPDIQSSYTREGVVKRLKERDSVERKKRDSLKAIAKNITANKGFTKITLMGETFKATYENK